MSHLAHSADGTGVESFVDAASLGVFYERFKSGFQAALFASGEVVPQLCGIPIWAHCHEGGAKPFAMRSWHLFKADVYSMAFELQPLSLGESPPPLSQPHSLLLPPSQPSADGLISPLHQAADPIGMRSAQVPAVLDLAGCDDDALDDAMLSSLLSALEEEPLATTC